MSFMYRTHRLSMWFVLLSSLFLISLSYTGCSSKECQYDSDCEGQKLCKNDKCVKDLIKNGCSANSDCGQAETCSGGKCITAKCQEGQKRPCYDGAAATKGVGDCKAGQQTCSKGNWGWCENQHQPSSEVCDRQDNDCNGKVDDSPSCKKTCSALETRPCYTGPKGTKGIGICREGKETCNGGKWGACTGDVKPQAKDLCGDDFDNNCNGSKNENCGVCKSGATKKCYTGPSNTQDVGSCKSGLEVCQSGKWTGCQQQALPRKEVCGDNADNDCNGKVDELPSCNQACKSGEKRLCYTGSRGTRDHGICKAGEKVCQNGQWPKSCPNEKTPESEKCGDNKDNNCNGLTDEGCGACKNGEQENCYDGSGGCNKQSNGTFACKGLCKSGKKTCTNGQWGGCIGQTKPQNEKCGDNADNDCDGQVDEKCGNCTNGKSRSCYTGSSGTNGQGVCRSGQQKCISGNWETSCSNQIIPSGEKCGDKKDNDCDGQTDEGCKLHKLCTSNVQCSVGQICVGTGNKKAYCFQECTKKPNVCAKNKDGRINCQAFLKTPQGTRSVCTKIVSSGAICNINQSITCATNYECIRGKCKFVQYAKEGNSCNYNSNPPVFCKTGSRCIGYGDGFPSICLRPCKPPSSSGCSSGFRCFDIGGGNGVCMQNCTKDSSCSYTTPVHQCSNFTPGKFCSPKPLTGPVAFGGVCNYKDAGKRCQRGTWCLRKSGAALGYCTKNCTGSCPSTTKPSSCVTINQQGDKACLFRCRKSSECPSKLSCDTKFGSCFP